MIPKWRIDWMQMMMVALVIRKLPHIPIAAAVDVSANLGRIVLERHGSLASWLEVSLIGSPLRVCQKLLNHNRHHNSSLWQFDLFAGKKKFATESGCASLRKNALHRHFISPLAD